jgi:hypothetical protein
VSADSRMTNALALLAAIQMHNTGYSDRINRSVITLTGVASDIDSKSMVALAGERHVVQITVTKDGWSGTLRSQGSAVFSIDQGPPGIAFEDTDVIDALRLIADDGIVDVARYLALVPDLSAEVLVEVTNFPPTSGYEWYRTTAALEHDLASNAWLAHAIAMCEPGGKRRVIVHDADDSCLRTPGLVIQGPDTQASLPEQEERESVARYRAERLDGDFAATPTPTDLAPSSASGFATVEKLLNGISEQLTWLWLAKDSWWSGGGVHVRFDGVRVVEGSLTVEPMESATSALVLWNWATETWEPARLEAIRRSISYVTVEPNELRGAGSRILATASSVLDVMMRNQIAEVMAARNSARDAAFAAARSAADEGRSAAANTFDRVVVQSAAVVGLLLANEQHALGVSTTKTLLLVIVALLAILGIVVLVIDFPGARAGLAAFKRDLDLYRDHLSKADVELLKKMQSLRDASTAISRAQLLTIALLAVGIGADLYAYLRVR